MSAHGSHIGDASASMQVAIKTSSIIAGLLSAITQAKLSFFNTKVITPDKNPESIEEVLFNKKKIA
jgi:hypothetical protein